MILLLFKRDLSIAFRRGGGMLATLGFCALVFACFAFSLGPEALHAYAPNVLLVAVLLSFMLSLPNVFERDHADGTLEQLLLQPTALEWVVFSKLIAFWCICALPLIALVPLLSLMADLNAARTYFLLLTLLLATPTLSAIGVLGAAFTLGVKRAGLTQALIVLPLYIPVLIFAASAESAGAMAMLAAFALVSSPLSCLLAAGLLRLSGD